MDTVMFPLRMYKESFIDIVPEGDRYEPFEVGKSDLLIPYKILWTEAHGELGKNTFTFYWTEEV